VQASLDDKIARDILGHVEREFPKEACGLIIEEFGALKYVPCTNVYEKPEESFIIDPKEYAKASDRGLIKYIVHSHPNADATPSEVDKEECNKSGIPWIIVSYPGAKIITINPDGYTRPLIGREFIHGISDCYTLIRDYYHQVLHIEIPDFERVDNWWELGENLYLDNFEKAGFVKVSNLQKHDVILMQFFSNTVNHGAVYVGDNKILHHVYKRASREELYTDYWRRRTICIVRHKTLT